MRSARGPMRIYDISVTIREGMPVYEGDPGVHLDRVLEMARGAPANVSHLDLGVHTGTHVDAPIHFIPGGSGVEALPLDALIGRARVVEFTGPQHVTAADLEGLRLADGVERLLLKTRNSRLWQEASGFRRDFIALAPDAARWIVERALKLVGVDYLSVEPYGSQDFRTHRTLLQAGVVIIEGLNLDGIAPGDYLLACLPVKLAGCDGAPARAVLIAD